MNKHNELTRLEHPSGDANIETDVPPFATHVSSDRINAKFLANGLFVRAYSVVEATDEPARNGNGFVLRYLPSK
jgi:hypothetical protein